MRIWRISYTAKGIDNTEVLIANESITGAIAYVERNNCECEVFHAHDEGELVQEGTVKAEAAVWGS